MFLNIKINLNYISLIVKSLWGGVKQFLHFSFVKTKLVANYISVS